MTYKEMKANLNAFTTTSVSIPAIERAVRDGLSGEQMTWKKTVRLSAKKFTSDNVAYCDMLVHFMNSLDPYRINFFETYVEYRGGGTAHYFQLPFEFPVSQLEIDTSLVGSCEVRVHR